MRAASFIQMLLSGEAFRSKTAKKYYPFGALIAGFILIYIFMGYRTMQQQHRLTDLKNEVKDKKFEYLTISAERMKVTKQSHIALLLQQQGCNVQENQKAPICIE